MVRIFDIVAGTKMQTAVDSGITQQTLRRIKMAIPSPDSQQNQIQIEIDEQTAQGIYTNLAVVSHSETEIVIDFIFLPPQTNKAKVRGRIVTSPSHAKKILLALDDNIKKYEARFGKIEVAQAQETDPKIGFYH